MKTFFPCVLALLASQVNSECLPEEIPRSWLIKEISLQEIHETNYSQCRVIEERGIYFEGQPRPLNLGCKVESGNIFEHELQPGYKIYQYRSPKSCWEGLAGRAGYVLEINGSLVEFYTTALN